MRSSEKTFRFLPYNFARRKFEKSILEGVSAIEEFRERNLRKSDYLHLADAGRFGENLDGSGRAIRECFDG